MATTKTPKKKEKTKRLDLKVGMKDFGPISEGEIELKPLTVFIGPNNSGKSYAAMLIKSILDSYSQLFIPNVENYYPFKLDYIIQDFQDLLELLDQNYSFGKPISLEIPKAKMSNFGNIIIEGLYENILVDKIILTFASMLDGLIKANASSFELRISSESHDAQLKFQNKKLKLVGLKKLVIPDINIDIEPTKMFDPFTGKPKEEMEVWLRSMGKMDIAISLERGENLFPSGLIIHIFRFLISMMYNLFTPSFYLPAARSGIMQGHRALAVSIIERASDYSIKWQPKIPMFSSIIANFLSSLLKPYQEKGDLYELSQELEKEITNGKIDLESKDILYPEIIYIAQGKIIPLDRASSSISQLAPIILYLKYIVRPGSVLIIEEPEAHLHPANIRILAKYLVRLVRKGVNVLITTHSDYLLEQINNFYLLSKKTSLERIENYGYDKDDFIKSDELGVYEFHYDKDAKGYKISQAEISEDGIIESEIYGATEALYDETSRLQKESDDEE